ncbi:precorrin-3B synthase [Antrihabitans cavernicola]|uniref:Precorrin-3B synthase n=1 Tax=Antrihabitans cavernicola TaxID=2495913 RepID=A0A5A7S559_9NOCA|nr:precorrin-3B synthase [Spelaeibacter cavernicola]KAA0021310.1 precorrin-3B synthase [Spelaeibacter cavernicola]
MSRTRPDACPGALQLHDAADGPLARIRLPGGQLEHEQLQAIAEAARDLGNGQIELTSRGNLQLRGITGPDELAHRLADAGLLPSTTHERVRNIVASPLSGLTGGLVDVRRLVHDLDDALQDAPALAELPGRTLFTIDDGRGDVSALGADVGLHATGIDEFALILAGSDTGVRIPAVDAIRTVIRAAEVFRIVRTTQWRLAEIDGGVERVLTALELRITAAPLTFEPVTAPPVGWLSHGEHVSLGAGIRLGVLDARTAEFLAAVEHPIVVTPWRSIVIAGLDEWAAEQVVRVLAPMGLIFDETSPWLDVSSCTGSPGCAKSRSDVRGDLSEALLAGELPIVGRQHWVGCDRKCGRPGGDVPDVVATGTGYRIDGP